MSRNITSREYAEKLRALASELDGFPEFPLPDYWKIHNWSVDYFNEKGPFLAALKALGTGFIFENSLDTECAGSGSANQLGSILNVHANAKSVEDDAGSTPIFVFRPKGASFRITIYRDGVCKLVRPAEYDCAPLLAPNEW